MTFPTVSVRLTASQIQLIYPGLAFIDANHSLWRSGGKLPYAHPELHYGRRPSGCYQPGFGQMIGKLKEKVSPVRSRRARIQLNCFELTLAALAVRVTSQRVRHGHLLPSRRDYSEAVQRTLRKLENERKRAKRAYILQLGEADFAAARREWRQMLVFVRSHFLHCYCSYPKQRSPLVRHFRSVVNQCCLLAIEGLREREAVPVPEGELRRSVRLALRYVRRNRTQFGVKAFLDHPEFASVYLAEFVIARRSKQKKVTEVSDAIK